MNIMCKSDKGVISLGDTCIIYISDHMKHLIKIEEGQQIQTKFGVIKAIDLVNHPYGHQFDCKKGWVLPLRLTPEYWTQMVPHRTQILYQADISLILLMLDIKPGSIVVESGTGSGSMSHSILRAIQPNGFLHTFEFNKSRADEAEREFIEHRYENSVKVYNRNVCEEGFSNHLEGQADACLLDLPQTWLAIDDAYRILKPRGSRLCTFSPCIEQVQRNVEKMNQLKMKNIITYECLMRPFEVKERQLRVWTEDILDKLVEADRNKLELIKKNFDLNKKSKIDDSDQGLVEKVSNESNNESIPTRDPLERALTDPKANFSANLLPKHTQLSAMRPKEAATHSGFLTFACRNPC